jgi:cytochrome P450
MGGRGRTRRRGAAKKHLSKKRIRSTLRKMDSISAKISDAMKKSKIGIKSMVVLRHSDST